MIRLSPGNEDDGRFTDLAADLTPLLDVLFILIVFFVLTANSPQIALELALPDKGAAAAKPLKEKEKVVVAIFEAAGQWAVNGTAYDGWEAAQKAMKTAREGNPKARFVIAGDRKVPLGRFLQTLAFLREMGLKKTEIMMKQRLEEK